jgi:hypothetical protein
MVLEVVETCKTQSLYSWNPCTGSWMQENRFVSSCIVCCKPSAVAAAMGMFYMVYQPATFRMMSRGRLDQKPHG